MKQIQNRQKMIVKPRESAEKYLLKRKGLRGPQKRIARGPQSAHKPASKD